jgi:hypothetical protein
MADATADQVRRYVLDGSDDDLRRLLSLSESFAEHARRALRRVGVGPRWTGMERAGVPRGTVERLPRSAREAGLEIAEMIDDVVTILRAAKAGGYEWVTSLFLLDLVLRKPQSM